MSLIDRSLQRLRIVTKVLLFVVPLVALIAGIGLVGYFTASTLNGHMTVTRETINNLSDFQSLRSGLQNFSDNPTDETRATLASRIDEQENGIRTLDGLLTAGEDKAKVHPVVSLGEAMRGQQDKLWSIKTERDAVTASLDAALADMTAQGNTAFKQIDILRKESGEKESFAKALLFDAAAYQGLAERIKKFRLPVTMAIAPDAKVQQATTLMPHLLKQITEAEKIASDKVLTRIAEVKADTKVIQDILASSDPNDVKKTQLSSALIKFSKYESDFAKEAVTNSDTAAKRFVGMDSEISTLKTLIGLMNETFKGLGRHAPAYQRTAPQAGYGKPRQCHDRYRIRARKRGETVGPRRQECRAARSRRQACAITDADRYWDGPADRCRRPLAGGKS